MHPPFGNASCPLGGVLVTYEMAGEVVFLVIGNTR
jgi:hypothetical protein